MYSDSEFKYNLCRKAQNKNDQSNRRNLDSDSDYTIDPWDYTSDVSFWWFDFWYISFFINKKNKHYKNLNESIFRPLSRLQLIKQQSSQHMMVSDHFNYTIILPTESSKIYQLSLKHMKEDQPQLPTELINLREMNANHQNMIENLEKTVDETMRERFSLTYQSPLKTGSSYDYNHDSVYDFLRDIWESNKHDLKQIEDYTTKNNCCFRNGLFYFENKPLGQGDDKGYESMKSALYDILKDRNILKMFSDLTDNKNNVDQKITEIKRMSTEIV